MKHLLIVFMLQSLISNNAAFGLTTCQPRQECRDRLQRGLSSPTNSAVPLFAEAGGNEGGAASGQVDDAKVNEIEGDAVKALGPASSSASVSDLQNNVDSSISQESTASSQIFMITREIKRTMIEELGYKRNEVDAIRLELVANIIENQVQCPSEGMPIAWVDRDRKSANESVQESSMMEKLENESKYPLKFPLLAVSLVLFGKGFSDALITLIKVNIDFPGASLSAQFQGIPVIAIDFVCVLAGAGIGLWTFKTMK